MTSKNCISKVALFVFTVPIIGVSTILGQATRTSSLFGDDNLGATSGNNAQAISFELDVMPVLTVAGCNQGACHGKSRGQNGFQLSLLGFDPEFDYASLVLDLRGRRVNPSAVQNSLILQKGSAQIPHGGGRRLSPDSKTYQILAAWIAQGATRRLLNEPALLDIDVAPTESPLSTEPLQLSVTAKYSDDSTRDVTDMCDFQSSEPGVATVSSLGLVTPGKLPGEASIMIRYMGKIKTWNALIPQSQKFPPEQYAELPRWNFIDDLVWQKLEQAGVLPSKSADDATFLRRAYLDVIGRLPSADEARAFLDDSNSDKRVQLVDNLLSRPEYGDYWANKWTDLLRPNPYRVGIKATLNFDSWIREAFRKNKPYDQFVREIVSAEGSTWHDGPAVLFRDRRTPDEVASMISQLFLGVRLDCAKCHHHPFEKWSQEDFYGLSAYFARVGYEGTGLSPPISGGEEIVYLKDDGEVKHPLTKKVVPPKPLSGMAEMKEDDDPRQVLARWMTADDNPFFAKVAVNRLWAELMGRGLVEPVDDLRATNPATNAPLLDALAAEFRRLGFDSKAMLRTIMTSYAYGLSSLPNETNISDTRNYSRHYRTRPRAEVLLDAISDVTGVPDEFTAMPRGSRAVELWTNRVSSMFLDTFGRPDANLDPPCERSPDSTMVQTLHMLNAYGIQRKLHADEGLVARLAASSDSPSAIITQLYLTAYARKPTEEELAAAIALFNQDQAARRQTIEDLLWALLNTPEFMFKN